MRNIGFVLLFALIVISSCQSEDSPNVKTKLYSVTGNEKIIKIRLPNDVLPTSAFTRIHTNDAKEEQLYYYNSPGSEILIFNLGTTELEKRIKNVWKFGMKLYFCIAFLFGQTNEQIILAAKFLNGNSTQPQTV